MKTLTLFLAASALYTTITYAESVSSNAVQAAHQEMNQNRFQNMNTDELLEKRGTMTTQQEREQLHNELMNRQHNMTKEQKEKFSNRPENRTPKMRNQGQGQGMMQGKGKGGGR
jgi:hypothetical protein